MFLRNFVLFSFVLQGFSRGVPNPEEMGNHFEGDIVLDGSQEEAIMASASRFGISSIEGEEYRWPNGVVLYEITEEFDSDERAEIEGAMEEIEEKTCIRFTEAPDTEGDFIKIQDGEGCSSKVGKRGGEQAVTLSRPGCISHGTIIHELVHVLGFWHEQSRRDRDDFVEIKWENILPDKLKNFKKYLSTEFKESEIPYDYGSVMHYKADAFSIDDEDTIVPKETDAEIGQRRELSEFDALKINKMYCEARPSTNNINNKVKPKTKKKAKNPIKTSNVINNSIETTTRGELILETSTPLQNN